MRLQILSHGGANGWAALFALRDDARPALRSSGLISPMASKGVADRRQAGHLTSSGIPLSESVLFALVEFINLGRLELARRHLFGEQDVELVERAALGLDSRYSAIPMVSPAALFSISTRLFTTFGRSLGDEKGHRGLGMLTSGSLKKAQMKTIQAHPPQTNL